jgi:hypothetical protein
VLITSVLAYTLFILYGEPLFIKSELDLCSMSSIVVFDQIGSKFELTQQILGHAVA